MNEVKLIRTVRQALELLVQGSYDELENLTRDRRLTKAEIQHAVSDYGRTLVLPPRITLEVFDIYEIEGTLPKQWSVDIDLCTVEEGRSDLTLQLTLTDNTDPIYYVEIDDIHVL